jgi:hypothetical protein
LNGVDYSASCNDDLAEHYSEFTLAYLAKGWRDPHVQ